MPGPIRKAPSKQTYKEKCKNLALARAAKRRKKKPRKSQKKKPTPRKRRAPIRKYQMRKRRRTNTSSGNIDINPQYLSGFVTQTAPNAVTSKTFNWPVSRFATQANSAVVIEVLKLYGVFTNPPAMEADSITRTINATLTSKNYGTVIVPYNNPTVFAMFTHDVAGAFTAAGSYGFAHLQTPMTYDMTDGCGNGILIATDSYSTQLTSANYNAAATFIFKILYRFKRVKLAEYIGIVQSQQ